MSEQRPSIARAVIYRLSEEDAEQINRRRQHATANIEAHVNAKMGVQIHVGNDVMPNEPYAAVITRVVNEFAGNIVNLKVLLDGNDDFWAPSREQGDGEGQWQWPTLLK